MRPTSPRLVLVLLTTLGLVGPLARPAAAAAADWTVTPAANDFGAGREGYGYTLNPGGRLEDGVAIANPGATPLTLTLDAEPEWVQLDRRDVTVAPGESLEIPFAVVLPEDARPGDHAGAIVATDGPDRARIPIRLRVGGALTPSLAVEGVRLAFAGSPNPIGKGDATVTYTIRNTGNAILTARQAVSVSGPFGRWKVGAENVPDSPPLLPGETRQVSVPLHDVTPALRLTAAVTLVALMTDAAGSTAPLAEVKASGHAWTVPWSLLLALLVLCGLAIIVLVVRPRRRRRASRY